MGFTCATAAVGLHASEVAWIPLSILAALSFLAAGVSHWREGRSANDVPVPLTLADTLTAEIAAGEDLLREARQSGRVATNWQIGDIMRRGDEWAARISAALAEHGEHDRLKYWSRLPVWVYGRPNANDPDAVTSSIVGPLWERVQAVEQFARDIDRGVALSDSVSTGSEGTQ